MTTPTDSDTHHSPVDPGGRLGAARELAHLRATLRDSRDLDIRIGAILRRLRPATRTLQTIDRRLWCWGAAEFEIADTLLDVCERLAIDIDELDTIRAIPAGPYACSLCGDTLHSIPAALVHYDVCRTGRIRWAPTAA